MDGRHASDTQLPGLRERQILSWIGVISQLMNTRVRKILETGDLPPSQFSMLHHFCHFPDEGWTVSRLAGTFEMQQPGISKVVAKLKAKGYLEERPDPRDKRVKHFYITEAGVAARNEALYALAPDMRRVLGHFDEAELAELHRLLRKLRDWLDRNRADYGES
jgi:DNA-binding MarR family transcriptional regulator